MFVGGLCEGRMLLHFWDMPAGTFLSSSTERVRVQVSEVHAIWGWNGFLKDWLCH